MAPVMRIHLDFDGTIASCDVTDLVLQHFAPPEWEEIEAAWKRCEIDAAECMSRQIALLECDRRSLNRLLDGVGVDPGFEQFVAWCRGKGIPLTIVSDGVDYFIRRILGRFGLADIPVFANRLVWKRGRCSLSHPWRTKCIAGSGVCKCAVVGPADDLLIYVGDGRSDQCVAPQANLLFAKDELAAFCRARGLPFLPFANFHDVRLALAGLVMDSEGRRCAQGPADPARVRPQPSKDLNAQSQSQTRT